MARKMDETKSLRSQIRNLKPGAGLLVSLTRYDTLRNTVSLMNKAAGITTYATTCVGCPVGYAKVVRRE
ncbi:MAG: hypothetical protein HUK04_04205 [Bacteroidaceae bacterium]|mgnify:CR=1 FL=1|nr:hypothetical protein [Bacteroidaceae bacterium]